MLSLYTDIREIPGTRITGATLTSRTLSEGNTRAECYFLHPKPLPVFLLLISLPPFDWHAGRPSANISVCLIAFPHLCSTNICFLHSSIPCLVYTNYNQG